MNSDLCEYEEIIAAALRRGPLDAPLRDHLAGCPQCQQWQIVSQFLAHAAPASEDLPPAGLIWWRAQLAAKRQRTQRAVAAIELMQRLALAIALVVLSILGWFWGRNVSPAYYAAVFSAAGIFLAAAAVLFGWARGKT